MMRPNRRIRPEKRPTEALLQEAVAEAVAAEVVEAVDVVEVEAAADVAVAEEEDVASKRRTRAAICSTGEHTHAQKWIERAWYTQGIRMSRVGNTVRFRDPRLIKYIRDHVWFEHGMHKSRACTAFGKIGFCV